MPSENAAIFTGSKELRQFEEVVWEENIWLLHVDIRMQFDEYKTWEHQIQAADKLATVIF